MKPAPDAADLDIEQPDALIAYLRARGHIAPDETPAVTVLAGGVSNRTVQIDRASGESWVVKQALEKLRVQVDWFSSPQRIHREAEGLRWLAKLAPPGSIPTFVFEDHDAHVLAMSAVPQPHTNWKTMLLAGDVQPAHVRQFGMLLASIHCRAADMSSTVSAAFDDQSFFESLRLEPYYAYSATQVPEAADFLTTLIADTRAHPLTLVHGDYSPKNILVHQDRLVLLDYEVIHWGDPAFDLGFSLTHLLSKAHHLPAQREPFAQAARLYWQVYAQAYPLVTMELEARAVRHTLACLLARVAGRSPLEYLSAEARTHQRRTAVDLMHAPTTTIPELIMAFIERL
ncbi:MAG: aminoglycoside phosphotransferase family protein [Anaerolineae bacterium]|nr:aminoglycoside phosphotransferase family protein [Anaerolineae bacterium]